MSLFSTHSVRPFALISMRSRGFSRAITLAFAMLMACATGVAFAQTARLTEGPRNNAAQFMGKSAVDYPMLQAALQNQTASEITLSTLTIHAEGTGDDRAALDLGTVRLVYDKDANGEASADEVAEPVLDRGEYDADNGTVFFDFGLTPLKVSAGTTVHLIVLYTFNGTPNEGETFRVFIESAADITLKTSSTGADVGFQSGAFPINGISKTIGQGSLTVSLLADSVNAKISPYIIAGFPRSELMRLQLTNSGDERVVVRSIRFTAGGSADESLLVKPDALEFVLLPAAGSDMTTALPALAVSSFTENNGTVEMTLDPELVLARNESKWASLAVTTNVALAQYGQSLRFFMEEGAVSVDGLDSLANELDVQGESLSGPTRAYQGHGTTVSTLSNGVTTIARGAADIGVFPIRVQNGVYEDVLITSVTLSVTGSLNDAAEFEKLTLWQDRVTAGVVNPPGSATSTDVELDSRPAFEVDNGTLTFVLTPPVRLNKNAITSFLVGADMVSTATLGRQFRLSIPTGLSVSGVGLTSGSPTTTTGAPLNGPLITVSEPPPPVPPSYPLHEGATTVDAFERSALPRSGNAVLAWNFAATISATEDLYFASAKVQLLGDVDDSQYIDRVELWWDKSREGNYDKNTPNADVRLAEAVVTADNELLSFAPISTTAGTTVITRNRDNNFYLLLYLKSAPTEVYGKELQFRIPDGGSFVLKGKTSGLLGAASNAPLTSRSKKIIQPRATLVPGPRIIPPRTVQTCINNCGAETVQFQLTAGVSEGINWQSISVNADAVGEGLNDHVSTPLVVMDGNSNGEIDNSDLSMSFRTYPFADDLSTVDLAADLSQLLPGYTVANRERIQLPIGKKSTFLVALCLGSNQAVSVDGTVSFQGTVPSGSIKLVGADSGDEVIIDNDTDLVGQINQMTQGSVTIANVSSGIQNYSLRVPPGSPAVESMVIKLTTSIIEPVTLQTLVFDVDTSQGTDLAEILETDAATLAIKYSSTEFATIAKGVVDLDQNTISFSPGSFESPFFNNFYTYYSPANTTLAVFLKIKTTAPLGETMTLSLCDAQRQKFSGSCSLVDEDAFPITPLILPGCIGRPITFDTTTLTVGLSNPTDDLPSVAFPGNNSNYPVVRLNLDADMKVEGVLLQRIAFRATGTAHDVNALAATGAVRLIFNGTFQKEGVFDADNGTVVFDGLNNLDISTTTRKMELQFNPSDSTKARENIGQTIELSIEPDGIGAIGKLSGLPVTRFVGKEKVDQKVTSAFPFKAPPIRIGAGRVFAMIDQPTAFGTRHVRLTPNVVSKCFLLRPDRSEALDLEEIVVKASGSLNDFASIGGASVRVYANNSPTNTFTGTDTVIGVGTFDADDGSARVRFTPSRRLNLNASTSFLVVVDINGNAKEFETFTHSLVGVAGVVARGVSSGDLASPMYGSLLASNTNPGVLNGKTHTIARATMDLALRAAANTPDKPVYILPNMTDLPILAFDYTADSIENCNVTSFTLQNYGSKPPSAFVTKARLYIDSNKNGKADSGDIEVGQVTPTGPDMAITIPFTQVQGILAGAKGGWLVTYDIEATNSVYETLQGGLDLPVKTTATPSERVIGGAGVRSAERIGAIRTQSAYGDFKGTFYKFTSGIIDVKQGANSPKTARTTEPTTQNYVLAQLTLTETNNLEAAKLTKLEFNPKTNEGMDFATALAGTTFSIYREGAGTAGSLDASDVLVGTGAYNNTGGRIEIDLSAANEIIAKQATATYLLTGSFNVPVAEYGKDFYVEFAGPELAKGIGQTTNLPTTFSLSAGPFTTSAGAVRFAISTNIVAQESGAPSTSTIIPTDEPGRVVLVISVTPSAAADLTIKQLILEATGTLDDSTAFPAGGIKLYQDTGNGTFEASDILAASGNFTTDNGRIVFNTISPSVLLPRNVLRRLFVVMTLSGTAPDGATLGFRIPDDPEALQLVTVQTSTPSLTTFKAPTALPIATGPWTILARRLTVTVTPPGPIADFGVIPATQNVMLYRSSAINSAVESLTMTSATLTLSGNWTTEKPFVENSLRLYNDNNNDGKVNSNETILARGVYDVATKTVRFSAINNYNFGSGTSTLRRSVYVLGDFTPDVEFGNTFQLNMTEVRAHGQTTRRPATITGLPAIGPIITIQPPTVVFKQAGAETAHPSVLNVGQSEVLLTLQLNTDATDDVKLRKLSFEKLNTTEEAAHPAAADDVVVSGSLKLVLDVVRDGVFDPAKDTVLGSGGYLVDSKVSFGPSPAVIPRGSDTYLLLVGQLDGTTFGKSVTFRALEADAEFVSNVNAAVKFVPQGLPQDSGTRMLFPVTQTVKFPIVDDFDTPANTLRPNLAWRWISDPARARSGTGYYTGNDLSFLPVNADYSLQTCYPLDLSTWPGGKRVSFWVRTYVSPTSTKPNGEFDVFGPADSAWAFMLRLNVNSTRWRHVRLDMLDRHKVAPSLITRFFIDGHTSLVDGTFLDVDRIMYIPKENPLLSIRSFTNGAGTAKTTFRGNPAYPVSIQLQNIGTNPIRINEIGWWVQNDNGENRRGFVTATRISGKDDLNPREIVNYSYTLAFDPALTDPRVELDIFVRWTETTSGMTITNDSSLLPFDVTFVKPTADDMLMYVLRRVDAKVPSDDFDPNEDGLLDSSDFMMRKSGS